MVMRWPVKPEIAGSSPARGAYFSVVQLARTLDSGSSNLGSSPSGEAMAASSNWTGQHPLKVQIGVQVSVRLP